MWRLAAPLPRSYRPPMATRSTRGRTNNFDTLRIIAALAVLGSHAFPLAQGINTPQPLKVLSRGQTDLGSAAVLVFFVISGYLITQSFDRAPVATRFLKARCLRIFPALLVAVLLTAVMLGPAFTALSARAYFADPATATYVLGNSSLLDMRYRLPGLFGSNPTPSVVNGSLWTLQYEFLMYLGVLALGKLKLLRPSVVLVLLAAILVLNSRWTGGYYVSFGAPFVAGAALYLWRDRIPLDWRLAALSAVVVAASLPAGGFRLAFTVFGAYLVIYLAMAPSVRLPDLARRGDFSYGVYVFAYPVQQSVSYLLGPPMTWYANLLLSLPMVFGLAALSWHFIEKPALALKRSATRPAARVAEAAERASP